MPNIEDFRSLLRTHLAEAERRGDTFIEINSGSLHREAGHYPGLNYRMRACCEAMMVEKKAGDQIMRSPPMGCGASLTIRYKLPR